MPFPSHSYELLLACTQSERDDQKIEHCAREIEDWDDLLHLAYLHGIYPLVAKALKTITSVPEPVKITLKQKNTQIAQRNMVMSSELISVIQLLQENQIDILSFKGPILSLMAYGDITQRQYADIDILVPKDKIYKAVKILLNHGYSSEYSVEFLKNNKLLQVGKDFSIFNITNNIHIELHWQLFLPRQIKKSNISLFSHKNPIYYLNNYPIYTLEDNSHFIYLLLHGSNHMWERLEWIIDIDRFIKCKNDVIDWKYIDKVAKDMEIEMMFYLGLALVKKLFETELPEFIIDRISELKKLELVVNLIVYELSSSSILKEKTKSTPLRLLYTMRHNDKNLFKAFSRYLVTFFTLKYYDIYVINLPNYLSFLYYPIRLFRLLNFYLFKN